MEPEPTRGDCQVVQNEAVPTEGFRWIGLRKLQWKNKTATQPWEAVERTTRKGQPSLPLPPHATDFATVEQEPLAAVSIWIPKRMVWPKCGETIRASIPRSHCTA